MRVAKTIRAETEGLVSLLRDLAAEEDGANLAEYALLLVLVAVVTIPVLATIGPKVAAYYASYTSGGS